MGVIIQNGTEGVILTSSHVCVLSFAIWHGLALLLPLFFFFLFICESGEVSFEAYYDLLGEKWKWLINMLLVVRLPDTLIVR